LPRAQTKAASPRLHQRAQRLIRPSRTPRRNALRLSNLLCCAQTPPTGQVQQRGRSADAHHHRHASGDSPGEARCKSCTAPAFVSGPEDDVGRAWNGTFKRGPFWFFDAFKLMLPPVSRQRPGLAGSSLQNSRCGMDRRDCRAPGVAASPAGVAAFA